MKANDNTKSLNIAASQFLKEKDYWVNRLAGEVEKSYFPYDHLRAGISEPGPGRASLAFTCDAELLAKLNRLSGGSDTKLHVALVAGVVGLLARYTNKQDILVVTSIDKQDSSAPLVNTILPLKLCLIPGMTFKELLLSVREVMGEAFENQNYPIETLISPALFDVVILLDNIQEKKYVRHIQPGIIFSFRRTPDQLESEVEFDTSKYKQESIARIFHHFQRFMGAALSEVNAALTDIDLLSQEERRELAGFNDVGAEYPGEKTIHELFALQAEKTPDNTAAAGPSALKYRSNMSYRTYISYRELNERANSLARLLIEKGIKPGNIVGIMMERSIEMMIGILGILKAGAAYLPIDPDYPQERIDFMLKDSSASILLAEDTENTGEACSYPSRLLPFYPSTLPSSSPSTCRVSPTNLAYVIYTSGSTGKPKGTAVEHRALVNYAWWAAKQYVKNEKVNFPFYTSIAFDLTVTSLFTPLITGNTIFIYRGEDKRFLVEEIFDDNKVEIMKVTPAHLMLISSRQWNHSKIRRIIAGGEKLDTQLARRIVDNFNGNIEIYNEYGPTEAAVGCMIYKFDRQKDDEASVPIGGPAANVQIYLLDAYGKHVPGGGIGEIHIAGHGLARGYLNQPALTAERFIPNPFRDREKMFKTGDLARRLASGNIEFLGRMDQQVKIRGFRVEPGEIENQLLARDDIKEAAVVPREDKDGNLYLCAYIVSDKTFTGTGLREYLSGRLPDYMIPSYFVPLERIPLTPNGKVDGKSLPEPRQAALGSDRAYIAPRDAVEQKLVDIWQKVLGRNALGIEDNFFEIGGDSIKTIQIISRMQKAGYKIETRDIFRNPRISQLAPLVKKIDRIADQSLIEGTVPLTPAQKWFFENITVDNHHFNQAVMFYAREGFDEAAVKAVFTKLLDHHDALRMTFRVENGEIVQTNHGPDYPLHLQVYDCRNIDNAVKELENRANHLQASINLEKGPLMKLGLFHLDDGDRLLIVIHHLVVDGVSWRILMEDISTLFRQYKDGEPLNLPLKTDSFKLWSEELGRCAHQPSFLEEKTYWQELESQAVPVLEKDFRQETNHIKDAISLSFHLSAEETNLLLTKVNNAFATEINDILLTALGLSFNQTFGVNRLLIAMEGHGREEILKGLDVSRTIGWFTSIYPVLSDISFSKDPGRQIKEIKESLRRVPNKGIGYGMLKYLTAEEHKQGLDFKLKPRVIFNYLGQFDADVRQMPFAAAGESYGTTLAPQGKRVFDIDVTGIITNNRLGITLTYNKKHYKPGTMAEFLENMNRDLRRVISYCLSRKAPVLTPSDLLYTGLSIEKLDQLANQYPLENIYTLSPMQEGKLFHTLYNTSFAGGMAQLKIRVSGNLDLSLFEQSINELFKRYDILRAVFVYRGVKVPIQIILKERRVDFLYRDLRNIIASGNNQSIINELMEKDRQRSFDLGKDSLLRLTVVQTGAAEYEITWSFHHILVDGWCIGILFQDFLEIYNSRLENRPYQLPGVHPYKKYIQWLMERDKQESATFWKQYLEGFDKETFIPKNPGAAGDHRGYRFEKFSMQLSEARTSDLHLLAARNQVTLNTVLQAAWGIILSRYNDVEDVVFGSVVSGRPSEIPGIERMIGLFINTIPVRMSCKPGMPFNELLDQVQEKAVQCEPHHHYPLSRIQAACQLKRNLLDHIMVFENYPLVEQVEGIVHGAENKTFDVIDISDFSQPDYDLHVVIYPGNPLGIEFRYNGLAFEKDFIKQMARRFEDIINRVTGIPDERVKTKIANPAALTEDFGF